MTASMGQMHKTAKEGVNQSSDPRKSEKKAKKNEFLNHEDR